MYIHEQFFVFRPHRMHPVHKMRPFATNGVAWSVAVRVSVCLLVTFVSPAKRLNPLKCRLGEGGWLGRA